MKWLKLGWQNLGSNRRRTVATLLLVAMGVAGIMTTSGFARYTYDSLREFAMRENGQLILTHPDYFEREEAYPLELGLAEYDAIRQQLLQDPDIRYVLASTGFTGLITNGEKSTIFMGEGVDPDLPKVMGPALSITDGRMLSQQPDAQRDYEVLLGKGLADSLNATIGTGLTLLSSTYDGALNAIDVEVQGILSTGVPELDARLLRVHNETAQFLVDADRVSQLSVYLRDTSAQAQYEQRLSALYPELKVTPWQDRAFFYRSVKNLYDRIFGVMGGVILIMVLFAVFNTSAMSVMERIREIGMLAAMGTHRREIVRLFLIEASYLAILGTALGLIISGFITLLLIGFPINMPPPPGQTEGYPLQVYFSWQAAGWSLVLVWMMALAASALAVRKGVRYSVAEALRYA